MLRHAYLPSSGRVPATAALLLAVFAAAARPVPAQGFADRLRRKAEHAAKRAVEARVERRTAEGARGAMDAAEAGARRAATAAGGAATGDSARRPGAASAAPSAASTGAALDGHGTPAAGAPDAPSNALRPGEGAWANYDFTPGERVLFADDFTRDAVGDFPRRLQLRKGSLEVVEWRGRRFLRAGARENAFTVTLPEALPRRFTLEFDYSNESGVGWGGLMVGVDGRDPVYASRAFRFRCNHDAAGVESGALRAVRKPAGDLRRRPFRCRLLVDGDHAKAYVDEERVANAPGAAVPRGRVLWFSVSVFDPAKAPALLGDIRVAAGGRTLYDALAERGRVATQGVYFDVGSDRVRPESTPTLKEIAAMLAGHPDLRLAIEGHTDDTGEAAANLALSGRRAAAVRAALVAQFGADAARLTARGLGQTRPAGPNATPEGRQQNRRVELVRL